MLRSTYGGNMLTYVLIGIIALLAVALLIVAVLLYRLRKWTPPPGPGN